MSSRLTEVTVEACCVVVLVIVVSGPLIVCVTHFVEYLVMVCAGAVEIEVIVVPGSVEVSILWRKDISSCSSSLKNKSQHFTLSQWSVPNIYVSR